MPETGRPPRLSNKGVVYFAQGFHWILGLAVATCCLAETSQFEGRPIVDIQYSPAQPLAPQDLAKAQMLQIGSPLQQDAVATAIDNLFATGHFDDIAVEAEPSGNGVIVRFVFQLVQLVGRVAMTGNAHAPPNREQNEATTPFMVGSPFNDEDVDAAVKSIHKLLDDNGFYEAK